MTETSERPLPRLRIALAFALSPIAGPVLGFLAAPIGPDWVSFWAAAAWGLGAAAIVGLPKPREPVLAVGIGLAAGLLAVASTFVVVLVMVANCDGCLP